MIHLTPTPHRRNCYLDIETTSLDQENPDGALLALHGRVVSVCVLFDDGLEIKEEVLINRNEEAMLAEFWRVVKPTDLFVGHNIWSFDLQFLRQRSWILSVKPSRRIDLRRYYTQDLVDTLQLFSSWGATRFPSLAELASALNCGSKSGAGDAVSDWWKCERYETIANYCRQDVRLTFKVLHKLMFWPIPKRFTDFEQQCPIPPSDFPPEPSRRNSTFPNNLIVFPKRFCVDTDVSSR